MTTTPYQIAERYIGQVFERKGDLDHPFIQWCFSLCGYGLGTHDEVPWCSAFLQHPFWELRLPRSKSAAARSWLTVGRTIDITDAMVGWDVVVLSRGTNLVQGHVGLFAGLAQKEVYLLGGNQGNGVSVALFDRARIVGVRRMGYEV
jgi:uncharacterized protein (TIGR02594 family)